MRNQMKNLILLSAFVLFVTGCAPTPKFYKTEGGIDFDCESIWPGSAHCENLRQITEEDVQKQRAQFLIDQAAHDKKYERLYQEARRKNEEALRKKHGAPPVVIAKKPPSPTPRKNIDPDKVISASSGSGFAVSKNGHVVTNNHVIDGCQTVKIHYKGRAIPATVVTHDSQNDLALLKGDFRPSTVLPLSSSRPELLQDVYVAGYPFGLNVSTGVKVTKGIISSLTGVGNNFSEIQIDAALQPGNSGGPILDDKGNVVGVAIAKLDIKSVMKNYGVLPENTNFGIRTSVVRNILESSGVSLPGANHSPISKPKLGEIISDGTYYLSCWMTMAQIEKFKSRKVIFQNLN
jgi:S1-C subfamily serine protease